jgi:hypothetical protein
MVSDVRSAWGFPPYQGGISRIDLYRQPSHAETHNDNVSEIQLSNLLVYDHSSRLITPLPVDQKDTNVMICHTRCFICSEVVRFRS